MPVSENRLFSPDGLNRWFAVSSIFMTASILWFIEVDYARPWRDIQDDYYLSQATLSHLDYLEAVTQERTQEIDQAKQRLADAQEYSQQVNGPRRTELLDELEQAQLEFRKGDGAWSRDFQVLQVTKDSYEKALRRHGEEHYLAQAAHKQWLNEQDEVQRLLKIKEKWEDLADSLEAELKNLNSQVTSAQKHLRELESVAADALKKDQELRGVLTDEGLFGGVPVVSTIINMRLLDFISPKNTPGRHQINQYVLPDVRQRLNYMETYTTDRCTTCHVAIGDPEFSQQRLARKLERRLSAVNEALQREGLDPLDPPAVPVVAGLDKPIAAGQVTEHWDELTRSQQDIYFEELLAKVNTYLKATGRKTINLSQPLLAHPNLELYVTVDSPHPAAKMGCTVCHEGNPQETDFVQAAHTPPTHEILEQWKQKYYIHELGVPNTTFESVLHYWERPIRMPQYTEAGCAKCHSEISDIARFQGDRHGERINLGRQLFTDVGCINCHNIKDLPDARRVGPDLSQVAEKLQPGFVQQWAMYPQKFRPSTRMPHLFLQENSLPESANAYDPHPVLRTETEVAAISKYLFTISRPWEPIAAPAGISGSAKNGRTLFKSVGCLACHTNIREFGEAWITQSISHREKIDEDTARHRYLGMTREQRIKYAMKHFTPERQTYLAPEGARFNPDDDYHQPVFSRFAPELSGIGSKVSFDWLYSWLMDPTRYSPTTMMPSLRLTPQEAADLAAYLLTQTFGEFNQQPFEINHQRQKMVEDQVFELLSAQRSARRSRAIMADEGGELTDMLVSLMDSSPSLGATEAARTQEAKRIVGALSTSEKNLLYLGHKMISHYGCYACHSIPGFETATPPGTDLTIWAEKPISQLDFAFYSHAFHHMRHDQEEIYKPIYRHEHEDLNSRSPLADDMPEEISHTHAAFAKHKMLNPRIWDREKIKKPYDKLKMPNFYFNEKEAEALTTYLLSRIPPRVNDSLKMDYEVDNVGPIARGRHLTREFNCVACHQIEDNYPVIQQYFLREIGGQLSLDAINAPPMLWGEGAKVQHNWLHQFFQQVEPLRPWLQVRMPSFPMTGEQATTLVEYFAALSQSESKNLAKSFVKVDEFIAQMKTRAAKDGLSAEAQQEAGTQWYQEDKLEDEAASLTEFAIERKLIRVHEVDSLRTPSDRVREGHAMLLNKTRFIQSLYDVNFPFVEPPTPIGSQAEFKRGFSFFTDMGCLKCHVLGQMLPGPARNTDEFVQIYRLDGVRGEGDSAIAILNGKPYPVGSVIDSHTIISAENIYNDTGDVDTQAVVEGPGASGEAEKVLLVAPSAPNLSLTFRRLQRAWVYAWMLEPQLIQPGTKMPQNFPDGVSPFEGDPSYPGTANDHINMLVDFVYHAGAINARAPLPKIVMEDDGGDFEEDGDFDDEDFDDD